eukprot:Nitzschia sp. Nitz4//scaffold101_size76361//38753//43942//NITZ4_005604-RA/size76361-snap-gene-0.35-mRNA-1//-1//CDS//3329532164//9397//frame0
MDRPLEAYSDYDAQSSITMGTGNPDNRIVWSDDPEYAYLETLTCHAEDTSRLGDSLLTIDDCNVHPPRDPSTLIEGVVDASGLLYDTDADDTVARAQPDQQTTYWFQDRRSAVTKLDDLVLKNGRAQSGDRDKIVPDSILVNSEGLGTIETESDTSPKGERHDQWHDEYPHWKIKRQVALLRLVYTMILLLVAAIVGMSFVFAKQRNKEISDFSTANTIAPTLSSVAITTLSPTGAPTNGPTASPTTSQTTPSPTTGSLATPSPTNISTLEPSLSPTLSPTSVTSSPTQDPRESIEEILSTTFFESVPELNDPSKPQYQALDWLSEDSYTLGLLGFNGNGEGSRFLLEGEVHFRVTQRWVLATLFYSTGGYSAWKNIDGWLTSTDECGWEFVSSCNNYGAIVELAVENNGLVGTLPQEIGYFGDALEKLSFNSNSIGGSVPSTVGLLSGVKRLTLQANDFIGRIPTTIGNMASLQYLVLRGNDVTGHIPSELGNLQNLQTLDLAVTDVSGSIPSQLSSCLDLMKISLGSTDLSGTIPSVLGKLPLLRDFAAARTDITGSIPDGFCDGSFLSGLRMDCREVSCPCCTHCCVDGEGYCGDVTPSPTPAPTKLPSLAPTENPSLHPTQSPTGIPTSRSPTSQPTETTTLEPSMAASMPSSSPSKQETVTPTLTNFAHTESPTIAPTWMEITTSSPTPHPTTKAPTFSPTQAPVLAFTWSPTEDTNSAFIALHLLTTECFGASACATAVLATNVHARGASSFGFWPTTQEFCYGAYHSVCLVAWLRAIFWIQPQNGKGPPRPLVIIVAIGTMDTQEDVSDVDTHSYAQTSITTGTGNPDNRVIWSEDPENAYLRTWVDPEDTSLLGGSVLDIGNEYHTSRLFDDTDADDTIARVEPDQQTTSWFQDRRTAVTKIDDQLAAMGTSDPTQQTQYPSKTNYDELDPSTLRNDSNKEVVPGHIFVNTNKSGSPAGTENDSSPNDSRNDKWNDEVNQRQQSIVLLRIVYALIALLVLGIISMSILFKTAGNRSENQDTRSSSKLTLTPTESPTAAILASTTWSPTVSPTSSPSSSPKPPTGSIYLITQPPTTASPTMTPTAATPIPTQDDPLGALEEFFVATFPGSASDLQNPTAPQYQALDWLSRDEYTLNLLNLSRLRRRRLLDEEEVDLHVTQRWMLAVLFYSTGGDAAWINRERWLTPTDECSWEFVTCNSNGVLQELFVERNGLGGSLPREIGFFGEILESLSFNGNSIGGSLPSTVGLLTGVKRMTIEANNLVGILPTSVGGMTSLRYLGLRENDISGPIPAELGDMKRLQTLDLAVTHVSGSIPSQLSSCLELESISLGSTRLLGTIPSVLGHLSLLQDFAAARTDLSGAVPDGFCDGDGLKNFRMDCGEVSCPCCTQCCVDGGGCIGPTLAPTSTPTRSPTLLPTRIPTPNPTSNPTSNPTMFPTSNPTLHLTLHPTSEPTLDPTHFPTETPTLYPTKLPSATPNTSEPTSGPTKRPTFSPTFSAIRVQTKSPTKPPTESPTRRPTKAPAAPRTSHPTRFPTNNPTDNPSSAPVASPTPAPNSRFSLTGPPTTGFA